jgi:hypothetical protein
VIINNRFALAMSLAISSSLASTISHAQTTPVQGVKIDAIQAPKSQVSENKIPANINKTVESGSSTTLNKPSDIYKVDPGKPSYTLDPKLSRTVMCLW